MFLKGQGNVLMSSISLILTVHDKEFLLARVVEGIVQNASPLVRELIVVFDGCNDDSEKVFDETVASCSRLPFEVVKISTPDIWETRANNVALKQSRCDSSIIIQDDMIITEPDFDARLLKPINAFEDVFAVTGRTAHNDIIVDGDLAFSDAIGRDNPSGKNYSKISKKVRKILRFRSAPVRDVFGIRDVVNRGPLLLSNERLEALNYLDDSFAPLDLDDHDLCFRAFKQRGWVCGAYPVGYLSDLEWGGTRANPHSHAVWKKSNEKNRKLIIERHHDQLVGEKHSENRKLR